jgi:hypothetical protein
MDTPKDHSLTILIISGATGHTAEQVVNSALAQFDEPDADVVKMTNVRSASAIRRIFSELKSDNVVICHSLVTPKIRDVLLEEARQRMIPTVDILGRLVAVFGDHLGTEPHRKAGLSYRMQKEYFDRMDAVSFTLEHDDGAGFADLKNADVVLVGVSRASKSVTCFYLGYRGIRAANVPLVWGCDIPEALLKMPKEKVIGLTINVKRLQNVREVRRQTMGAGPLDYYVDREEIAKELQFATELISRHHWRRIDVSYMAVEEIARKVLEMIRK